MLYVIIGKSDENDTFHDGNFLIASFNEKEINLKKLYRYKIYKVYRVEIRDGQIFEYYTFTVNTFYEVLGLQDQMGYYYGNIIYCPIDIGEFTDQVQGFGRKPESLLRSIPVQFAIQVLSLDDCLYVGQLSCSSRVA